ncbi:hypothetical protein Tco_1524586 [Tanacetum coccineum]
MSILVTPRVSALAGCDNATTEMLRGLNQLMERREGGGMYLLWVPLIGDVGTLMMDETHASRYLVHSGVVKTYYDLRDISWWKVYFVALVDIAEGIENTAKTRVLLIILKRTEKKYLAGYKSACALEEIKVDKTLRFVEEPVEIIDREVKSLKRSRIPIVKSIGTRSEVCRREQEFAVGEDLGVESSSSLIKTPYNMQWRTKCERIQRMAKVVGKNGRRRMGKIAETGATGRNCARGKKERGEAEEGRVFLAVSYGWSGQGFVVWGSIIRREYGDELNKEALGCHGHCGDDGVGDGDEGGVPTVEMVTGETVMMALAVGGDDNEDGEGGDGGGDRSMVEKVLHAGDDESGSKWWEPVHIPAQFIQLFSSSTFKRTMAIYHLPDGHNFESDFDRWREISVDKTLRFVEEPVEIMDREIKRVKHSRILIVKVRWDSKRGPEYTWKREDHMKSKYPHLFASRDVESSKSDQDVIHGSSSSHVTLSIGLTCLEHTDLSINAQSTEVDIPLVNDDNAYANEDNADFINNEDDVVAHVLDDDDVVVSDDDEVMCL